MVSSSESGILPMKLRSGDLANYRQLQGKEVSYNNIADTEGVECVKTF